MSSFTNERQGDRTTMAGTKSALRTARMAVIAFAVVLAAGAVGSTVIASQTLTKARAQATADASRVTDELLVRVFTSGDLSSAVSSSRSKEISDSLLNSGFGSSGFDTVTIWKTDGTVVYSTNPDQQLARVPSEVSLIRAVLKDGASAQVNQGIFSAYVPLTEGAEDAVAELDRPYGPIAGTARPLRMAGGLLALLFLSTLYILYRLSRAIASNAANTAFRPTSALGQVSQAPQEEEEATPAPRPKRRADEPTYAQAGYREESEARRRAEERAKALEEQVGLLQEQYRNSLTELQSTQKKLQDAVTSGGSRVDPRLEERVLKSEGQVRLLEGQLHATTSERDKLAKDLLEASRALESNAGPDPQTARRLQQLEQEGLALRAELEGTRTELDVAKRELNTHQTRANELTTELDAFRTTASDAEGLRTEIEGLRRTAARVDELQRETDALRSETTVLREEAEHATALRAQLEETASGRADAERQAEASRNELQATAAQLEEARAEIRSLRATGEERTSALDDELRGAKAAAEQAREELKVTREELASAQQALEARAAEVGTIRETASQTEQQLRAEVETLKEAITGREEELAAAKAEAGTITEQAEAARAELAAARADAEAARGEVEAARGELEAARNDAETARGEAEAARARAEAAEGQIGTASTELRTTSAELDALRAAREAERTAAEQALAEAERALADKEAELNRRMEEQRAALQTELEGIEAKLKTQLDATVSDLRAQVAAAEQRAGAAETASAEAQGAIDAREAELRVSTERYETLRSELEAARSEMDTSKGEALAAQEQVRAARDELDALRAMKSGDENALALAQADAQAARRELEAVMNKLADADRALEAARSHEAMAEAAAAETEAMAEAAAAETEALRARLAEVETQADGAQGQTLALQARVAELQADVDAARAELTEAQAEIQTELARSVDVARRAENAERELAMLREQQMAASADGADRENLEQIAKVAHERLAAQTEKLTQTEDRARAAEHELEDLRTRLQDAERELVTRGPAASGSTITSPGDAAGEGPIEDRRASTPFVKELSVDAKKSLTQILGLTLTLKHKKTPQEQAPFLRQLSAMVKRLDRTVSDLAEADKLARGQIELNVRRTNLEALVERVVEESGVGSDHDLRVETEELVVAVDPLRTEQILNGLLRNSADRTSPGSQITVRVQHHEGGALLSVEDKETSSDGSLNPVVARLADVMGGWARVEGRPSGGSAFRVYLPDANGVTPSLADGSSDADADDAPSEDRLQITVESPEEEDDRSVKTPTAAELDLEHDPWAAGQLLVQELQRLSQDGENF